MYYVVIVDVVSRDRARIVDALGERALVNENPAVTAEWAEVWIYLALCERDRALAERALATMPEGYDMNGLHFPRSLMEGCAARAFGDAAAARKAFTAARAEVERTVREQPDYGPPLCVLGLIDAGLGRKEEAMREGRRASELLPVTKDAVGGAHIMNISVLSTRGRKRKISRSSKSPRRCKPRAS